LYASLNIVRMIKSGRMRLVGHGACMGEMRNTYKSSIGNPKRKRPLRRPQCRWEYNITRELKEMAWEGVDQIHLG